MKYITEQIYYITYINKDQVSTKKTITVEI